MTCIKFWNAVVGYEETALPGGERFLDVTRDE
jgi:hypothetical protein